ncbi:MAG: hypothetical protein HYR72_09735 [Deltaproteobacteria bacterium]|nr:hypothetical protein [Deltaproteobacteria bacterium]MBI3387980.1 hypothetical protein [Deltaproteobacteria bacterium]
MSGTQPTDQPLMLRPDVVVTVLEREAVLLDLETKYFYSVNASGWAIVQLFETGVTLDHVRTQSESWGAGSADADAILRLVDVLISDRLVTVATQPVSLNGGAFEGTWATPTIEKHREPLQRIVVSAFDPTLPLAE